MTYLEGVMHLIGSEPRVSLREHAAVWQHQCCLVMSQCDTKQIVNSKMRNQSRNGGYRAHLYHKINLCKPVIPQYGYAVCCGVSKPNTVPVPTVPILEIPQVYLYPCSTLTSHKACPMASAYGTFLISAYWASVNGDCPWVEDFSRQHQEIDIFAIINTEFSCHRLDVSLLVDWNGLCGSVMFNLKPKEPPDFAQVGYVIVSFNFQFKAVDSHKTIPGNCHVVCSHSDNGMFWVLASKKYWVIGAQFGVPHVLYCPGQLFLPYKNLRSQQTLPSSASFKYPMGGFM